MAIEALGTPVLVSACFVITSIFSRSAAEIDAGACACGREVVGKIKRQMARRFLGRDMGYMHLSSGVGAVYGLGVAFCRLPVSYFESKAAEVAGCSRPAIRFERRGSR